MRATRVGSVAFAVGLAFVAVAAPERPALAADGGLEFRDAWPGVTFDKPVCVAAAPDGSDRLFVAQRGGKILLGKKFRGAEPVAPPKVFADLSASVPQELVES